MARTKSSKRVAVRAARAGGTVVIAGAFAYKFHGYAMRQVRPWFLTGIGHFDIDAKGNLTGAHRSSILPIHGQDSELATGHYTLQGTIRVRGDGTGDASILFTLVEGNGRNIKGNFFVLVPGNGDRLWLISSGQTVADPSKRDNGEPTPELVEPAPELVDLEAVRVAS